jgi:hypothetical protein
VLAIFKECYSAMSADAAQQGAKESVAFDLGAQLYQFASIKSSLQDNDLYLIAANDLLPIEMGELKEDEFNGLLSRIRGKGHEPGVFWHRQKTRSDLCAILGPES